MSSLRKLTVKNQTVVWRLQECMSAAGISTVRDLHKKLQSVDGESVDYTSLARMISQPPARLNLRTLVTLTIVLGCAVTDILDVGPVNQSERT